MQILRAIMIGDIVGDPGLEVLENRLPHLIKEYAVDFVVVNGENAAAGFGLDDPAFRRILAAGADVVTGGNHIWEKREFWPVLNSDKRVLRPLNYPSEESVESAGRGWVKLEKPAPWAEDSGRESLIPWLVVNLQGREFMTPLDCPFKTFDNLEANLNNPDTFADELSKENPVILVDFHAESSREKEALAYYLDGRAGVVAGTHTHVQTADERILPNGTAYITDLGMCGVQDGIIGMDTKICLDRARCQILYRMEAAVPQDGRKTEIKGIIVEFDAESRKAVSIRRISA